MRTAAAGGGRRCHSLHALDAAASRGDTRPINKIAVLPAFHISNSPPEKWGRASLARCGSVLDQVKPQNRPQWALFSPWRRAARPRLLENLVSVGDAARQVVVPCTPSAPPHVRPTARRPASPLPGKFPQNQPLRPRPRYSCKKFFWQARGVSRDSNHHIEHRPNPVKSINEQVSSNPTITHGRSR